ncbi:DUF4192 family protein [Streptomyces chiangmaiensis]|uniref:DUF4192 family protein n=2 Tax=Streptomyces chiangmaiensis TaxID=766497 RepID=A0ABU7FIP5_9ACTN|nr:DUF4192 family protein [Streptomyces chiangmaiensis]MED7823846.1 DUF4192 family protein [Streptomyces chiangmaiensis]
MAGSCGETQVTLRSPAELADALPYLLGYRPEDSLVLVALHECEMRGRFGGRARLGIPARPDDWPSAAQQLAHGLVNGSRRRGSRPASMIAYLVQEPASGETGRDVMERLRPLAQSLRTACGSLDVPVVEALCISDGRFWSYCCASPACCPPEGRQMGLPGTSVLAAAATYAGVQVRGSLKEFRARLSPWETSEVLDQEAALDAASVALVPRILNGDTRDDVATETLALAERVMARLAEVPTVAATRVADRRDDELLGYDEAAAMILGLQDRTTRDRAAAWMEGPEAAVALRLWRGLARRCVGAYGEHAAAPLTLAGWVAWSTGDELEAREALAMALGADPDYLFARLLHQACNDGLDPETVRRCLRTERTDHGSKGGTDPAAPDGGCAPSHGPAPARGRTVGDDRPAAPAGTSDDSPVEWPVPVTDDGCPSDDPSGEWLMAVTEDETPPDGCPVDRPGDAGAPRDGGSEVPTPAKPVTDGRSADSSGQPSPARGFAAPPGGEASPDGRLGVPAGATAPADGFRAAVDRVGPPADDTSASVDPVAVHPGAPQAATAARPPRAIATPRRRHKARPASRGSRSSRRSSRAAQDRRRRPADAPTSSDGPRRAADSAVGQSGVHRAGGRCVRGKTT